MPVSAILYNFDDSTELENNLIAEINSRCLLVFNFRPGTILAAHECSCAELYDSLRALLNVFGTLAVLQLDQHQEETWRGDSSLFHWLQDAVTHRVIPV